MPPPKRPDPGWKIADALRALKVRIDPYIWDQGQELFRREAVEDFQLTAEGTIAIRLLDPRDTRKFFVTLERDREGKVTARCPCPYRLNGYCRHQVVALEYLRGVSGGGDVAAAAERPRTPPPRASTPASPAAVVPLATTAVAHKVVSSQPILYRLFAPESEVATRPDGSLLRIVLYGLGSVKTPHRLGLQLFTGTGWTEIRTPDLDRWIARGSSGPHPRDAMLAAQFVVDGALLREASSETLAVLLGFVAGSDALVDRSGRVLAVSRWPWRLAARLVRGASEGVGIELECRSHEGTTIPFAEVSLVPAISPWIQLESGVFHPLESAAVGAVLAELQEADLTSITGRELDRLLAVGTQELERLCLGSIEIEPGLIEKVEGVSSARIRLTGTPAKLSGFLELCYGGRWVRAPATPEPWTVEEDGKIHRYPPAGQSISRARRELIAMGFVRDDNGWTAARSGCLATILAPRERPFVTIELPANLEALNLTERAPVLRVKVAVSGGNAEGGGGAGAQRRSSGISWLEVSTVLVDGARELPIDLSLLRESVAANAHGVLALKDGTVLGLDHDSVRSLMDLGALAESSGATRAEDVRQGRLRLPISLVGELVEPAPGREVEFAAELKALLDGLKGGAPESRPLLPLAAERLRPYQREAVRWLGDLAGWGLAGILADEMGLGKTVMTLTHFFGRADAPAGASPVLVVCPSSLVFNWIDECRRFFPDVRIEGLHGLSPGLREERIRAGADVLVTSYALLRRDREVLEAREFRAVVLDEAQHIKNADSQTAQAAFALRVPERWVLTGTPIENHLGELWSLFHFLIPGLLGEQAEFDENYAQPIARREEDVLAKLRTRVKPFILRRTKAQVLTELPPKIEQIERVPMTDVQRRVYDAFLNKARGEVESADEKESRFQILAALTRLRQICCHPRLVLDDQDIAELGADPGDITGGKFELCMELLEECIDEGHRVLLYSQFTSMLDLIEARLEEKGVSRTRLDGSTRDREGQVKRFTQDPTIPVFLISLKAGGFGLNLTQADTVIIYDPWWNPAAEDQAAARAHRMGQTLPVHVHKLITAGTVEEKIVELQATKRDLAGRVVDASEPLSGLSMADLRGLLFER